MRQDDLIDRLISDWARERPDTRPQAMQVVGRIIRLARRYEDEINRMLRPHGLSYSDFDVLATLRRSGGSYEQSPTQLQKNVLLTSGAMTACLRRLEVRGLISREAGQPDRRRRSAKLTRAGYELVEKLVDDRFALAADALNNISKSQALEIEALLRCL